MNDDLEAMDGLCAKIIEQRDRIEVLEAALLAQRKEAGKFMTDIVAAANKDAAIAAERIEALEAALREITDLIDSEADDPLDDAIRS